MLCLFNLSSTRYCFSLPQNFFLKYITSIYIAMDRYCFKFLEVFLCHSHTSAVKEVLMRGTYYTHCILFFEYFGEVRRYVSPISEVAYIPVDDRDHKC